MENKKYLVTGGTGFIGSALVKRLVKEGCNVRVLDNCSRGKAQRLDEVIKDIEFIEGDIRDLDVVKKACNGVDSVFHLAFVNGTEFFYTKPELVLDVGVKGMVNVLDACIQEEIKELVVASSSEVYQTPPVVPTPETVPLSIPDPLNPRYSYATGKIVSEIMVINYGRKYFDRVIIFRPHNVYGPDMGEEHVIPQFARRMSEQIEKDLSPKIQFTIQGTGQDTRAFVYIDDFIDGLIILKDKGVHLGIYHIGTEEEVSIKEVAIEVGKCLGKELEIIAGEEAKGGTPRRCPDISKLKALGYLPKYKLIDGMPLTVKWYAENS